jgi:pimeloyl-ACP methyl ester carboxylesterase
MERVDRFTTPDGVGLRVADSGPSAAGEPTLVLVHGWSQDLRTWDRVVEDLRRGGVTDRIVRHDHRGHGGSDAAPEGTATIGRAADDLAALITERVPEGPIVLAGHSMGGMTLMALAERHPDLVSRRVVGIAFVATASDDMADLTLGLDGRAGHLVARGERVLVPLTARLGHRAPAGTVGDGAITPSRASSAGSGGRARARALAPAVRALVFGHRPRREDVLSVAEQALAAHPPSVMAFRASIAEHRRTETLAALRRTPAVVLVGDRDRLCPQRHARVIAGELPDAEIALYPGAGHMITFERSTEVAAHLAGLLDAARAVDHPAGTETGEPARVSA